MKEGDDMKQIAKTKLTLNRITKGAVLYKADQTDDEDAITSIYLRRLGLETPYPSQITITVEVND